MNFTTNLLATVVVVFGCFYGVLSSLNDNKGKVIVTYFTDWTNRYMSYEQVPYSQITHINYAFAVVKDNLKPYFETEYLLPKLVTKAHENGVKVLMSVGGWSGSRYFSNIAKDVNNRKNFVKDLLDLINTYNLDGIDIDWEYPGRKGMECNNFDIINDANNFVFLLQEMREAFGKDKLITLAVRVEPFDTPNGPSKNMTQVARYVDFVNVMAYDINGAWSDTTGPNAPFEHEKGKGLQYSFKSSAQSWLDSGFPKDQIVMGVGFYGRSVVSKGDMTTSPENMYQPIDKSANIPRGDQNDGMWADPCPGAPWGYSGVWRWRNLRDQRVLVQPEKAGEGWERYWDQKSQTPWLFNKQTRQFISYDDPRSLGIKVKYILDNGLRGAMVWSSEQDNGELMEVVKQIISNNPSRPIIEPPIITTSKYTQSPSSVISQTKSSIIPVPTETPKPVEGQCKENTQTCTNDNKSFAICSNNRWFEIKCPQGTNCVESDGAIKCDYE